MDSLPLKLLHRLLPKSSLASKLVYLPLSMRLWVPIVSLLAQIKLQWNGSLSRCCCMEASSCLPSTPFAWNSSLWSLHSRRRRVHFQLRSTKFSVASGTLQRHLSRSCRRALNSKQAWSKRPLESIMQMIMSLTQPITWDSWRSLRMSLLDQSLPWRKRKRASTLVSRPLWSRESPNKPLL